MSLLVINAFACPYSGIEHDAKLYSVQVLNQVRTGHFAADLYLKYGSQDRYSIFSLLLAPVVAALGLQGAFFLTYLLSKALFLYAVLRFTTVLVENERWRWPASALIAASPLVYGGHNVFAVGETFLTARPFAHGFSVLAIALLLQGAPLKAAAAFVAALLLHPLITFPALCLGACIWLCRYVPGKLSIACFAAGAAAAALVLGVPSVSARIFGDMDPFWKTIVRARSIYNFPSQWGTVALLHSLIALALVGLAALKASAKAFRHFGLSLVFVILIFSAAALQGEIGPYALLFQSQPYRALWVLHLGAIPAAAVLFSRLRGPARWAVVFAAVAFIEWGTITHETEIFLFLPLLAGVFVIKLRGLRPKPRTETWKARCAAAALGTWVVLALLLRLLLVLREKPEMVDDYGILNVLRWLALGTSPLAAVFVVSFFIQAATSWLRRGFQLACMVLLFFFAQTLPFLASTGQLPRLAARKQQQKFEAADFVATYFREHGLLWQKDLQVYWPGDTLVPLWGTLGADSYFNTHQLAGNLFNRANAIEGLRRARNTSPFEVYRLKELLDNGEWYSEPAREFPFAKRMFRACENLHAPTLADLAYICRDSVDYAIVPRSLELGIQPESAGAGVQILSCGAVLRQCTDACGRAQVLDFRPEKDAEHAGDLDLLGCQNAANHGVS